MPVARIDPCHFHISLRIAVNGEDNAKEQSLSTVAISLTRQLDRECGIESLRESGREEFVRNKSSFLDERT